MCNDADRLLSIIESIRPRSAAAVLAAIYRRQHHFTQIQRATGLPPSTLTVALQLLRAQNVITRAPDGTYLLESTSPQTSDVPPQSSQKSAVTASAATPIPTAHPTDATPRTPDANTPATPAQLAAILAATVANRRYTADQLDATLTRRFGRPLHRLTYAQAQLQMHLLGIATDTSETEATTTHAPYSEPITSEIEVIGSETEVPILRNVTYTYGHGRERRPTHQRTSKTEAQTTDTEDTERIERLRKRLERIHFDNPDWLLTTYPNYERLEAILEQYDRREQINDPVPNSYARNLIVALMRDESRTIRTMVSERRLKEYRQRQAAEQDARHDQTAQSSR